ncbi:MAG: hypothetical protein GF311_12965 [Candidatus Lokiarchaeota archaeon]|nr:hypothetical protein [Candidatus Lokiarchaeota archaeon]
MAQSIRFIIAYAFIPVITALWFNTFTDFVYQERKKMIITIFSIIALISEIIFFIFLFLDQEQLIGTFNYAEGKYFTLFHTESHVL